MTAIPKFKTDPLVHVELLVEEFIKSLAPRARAVKMGDEVTLQNIFRLMEIWKYDAFDGLPGLKQALEKARDREYPLQTSVETAEEIEELLREMASGPTLSDMTALMFFKKVLTELRSR